MWKPCGTAQAQGKERDKGHLTEIPISGSNKRLSQHLSKEDLEQLVKERHFLPQFKTPLISPSKQDSDYTPKQYLALADFYLRRHALCNHPC